EAPKTKSFLEILDALKIADKKSLFVLPEYNDNLHLSLRNLQRVEGVVLADINTYGIVNADVLVLSETAAKLFAEEEKEAVEV
ncbi:MAG TPA: 50S ribosomal protein L4, partial [Puia sp.]|nr:50S ribosomal protein L4 [Puia sp.]